MPACISIAMNSYHRYVEAFTIEENRSSATVPVATCSANGHTMTLLVVFGVTHKGPEGTVGTVKINKMTFSLRLPMNVSTEKWVTYRVGTKIQPTTSVHKYNQNQDHNKPIPTTIIVKLSPFGQHKAANYHFVNPRTTSAWLTTLCKTCQWHIELGIAYYVFFFLSVFLLAFLLTALTTAHGVELHGEGKI